MADFYTDHDISSRVFVQALHALGHVARTSRAFGRQRTFDEEQLLFAAQQGFILITRNGDHFSLLNGAWILWRERGAFSQHRRTQVSW